MWSELTRSLNLSPRPLNRPTLLEIQPPTLPSTSRTLKHHLLSRTLRPQLLLKDICHLPLTSPAKNPLQVIPTPTHPQVNPYWISCQKRENCRTNWRQTSLIKNSLCRKSSPTGRRCGTTTSEDNPFAGPKPHAPGKVSINLPTDEWLCRKMAKLNITLTQGYPSRTSEAGGLQRDQFVRPPKSQQKWYGFHSNPTKDTELSVSSWHTSSSKLNSTYLRIARQAGIASQPPMSRPISQETLRKWERSARESTVICNHAASFNRCLLKVQQNMNSQLKAVRIESKGKAAAKVTDAVNELQFLLDFNSSICQAMAKAMEHLTEFIFVNMANTTLLRRDSYLKAGIKC